MVQTYMPLNKFYKTCVQSAKEQGYIWVISLIAREADAEEIFNKIEKDWASLNDLTNKKILFVFSANGIRKKTIFLHQNTDKVYQSNVCPFATIVNEKEIADERFTYYEIFSDTKPIGSDWKTLHTQSISDMARDFKIKEKDIPCLFFLNVTTGKQKVIKVSEITDVYHFIKEIISEINKKFEKLYKINLKLEEYAPIDKYYDLEEKLCAQRGEEAIYIKEVLDGRKEYRDVKEHIRDSKIKKKLKKIGQWKRQYMNSFWETDGYKEYLMLKKKQNKLNAEIQKHFEKIDIRQFCIERSGRCLEDKIVNTINYNNYNGHQVILNDNAQYYDGNQEKYEKILKLIEQLQKDVQGNGKYEDELLFELQCIKTAIDKKGVSSSKVETWINNLINIVKVGSALFSPNIKGCIDNVILWLQKLN